MTRQCAKGLLLLCTLFSVAAPAHAQDQPSSPQSPTRPPGLTLSVGAGLAFFDPSIDYGLGTFRRSRTPVVSGSIEVAMNRFMRIQGEGSAWREERSVAVSGTTRTGPLGTGYTGDSTFADRFTYVLMAGNVIGTFGSGRFRPNIGAGAGLGLERRQYSEEVVGCVPHEVGACNSGEFSIDRWSYSLIVQFLAGVDVVLTPRMTAFANIRAAGLENYKTIMMGGVRWSLR